MLAMKAHQLVIIWDRSRRFRVSLAEHLLDNSRPLCVASLDNRQPARLGLAWLGLALGIRGPGTALTSSEHTPFSTVDVPLEDRQTAMKHTY